MHNNRKSFIEYLEGVDPKKYRSPSTVQKEEANKKKWKEFQVENQFSYGWSEFEGNPHTGDIVSELIKRSKKEIF